jgi:hypothetical protein
MITWLQTSLQKHHKVLLGTLLVMMIGSFVLADYIRNQSRSGFEGKLVHRGVNLVDARETQQARDLTALLVASQRPTHTDDFLTLARQAAMRQQAKEKSEDRLFDFLLNTLDRLQTADNLGIPSPSSAELKTFIQKYPLFANEKGDFDPAALKNFADVARDRLGLDDRRLQTAIGNAWRIQKLTSIGSPENAPALDALARRFSEKFRTRWTVETATFSRTGFTAAVPKDEKAVAAYFEAHKETYRVPEKLRLRVARLAGDIKAADSLPAPTETDLRTLAERRRDRFPLFGITETGAFLNENRSTLLITWREEKAGEAAAAKLSDTLVTAIPVGETRPDDAKVDAMIKAAGLTAKAIPAYGRDALPTGTGVSDALLESALELSPARWRTAAIPFGSEAFVFIYDGSVPSRIPALSEVLARVTADRDTEETDRLFAEAATAKAATIAAEVKAGKNFAEAAKAAGLTAAPATNFEYQKPTENLGPHLNALETLPVCGVSGALRTGSDRLVAHVVSRLAPAAAKTDTVADDIRQRLGRMATETTAQGIAGASDE